MHLYLLVAESETMADEDGAFKLDLLVAAETPDEARQLWSDFADREWEPKADLPDPRIFMIPSASMVGPSRVLPWHDANGVIEEGDQL